MTLSPNAQGALWMIASGAVFSLLNATVKHLGQNLDPFVIAFFRCVFGLAIILPFALRAGRGVLLTGRPLTHLARGLVGVAGVFCGMYAIVHLPLADAIAISFAKPLFAVLLAAAFLSERVGADRWLATAVGFLGVLIVVRPGSTEFELAHVVALIGAFAVADGIVLVKKLQGSERTATIMVYFGVVTSLLSLGPALWVWTTPSGIELGFLAAMAGAATLGQYCGLRAFQAADASAVVPYDYLRLIFAIALGFALFGEYPDFWTLAGSAVLIASTLYIAYREIALGRKPSLGG
ncbi:MAG: DMT family transporter [Tagaea sp.]|nr:DMT family transporter [Tagaea sp.]